MFIGLPLSDTVRGDVFAFIQNLMRYNMHGGVTWVAPEALHVTVQFLGQQDEAMRSTITNILNTVVKEFEPFTLTLNRIEAFPSLKQQRVIAIRCHNDGRALFHLRQQLVTALKQENIAFEEGRNVWIPHITLARNKIPGYFFRRLTELSLPKSRWSVERVVLYESQLTPTGPVYTEVYSAYI